MLRRRIPWWVGPVCCCAPANATSEQTRGLKTLDVREYRPLGTPIEFRFYQRYANHPNRQSGVQFLTHYNTHQRFRVNKDFIDYFNWGREQGQARLPHRHQRVAFDFDDSLHPTAVDEERKEWFNTQDPSLRHHPDVSPSFDPNKKLFSEPEHWNKMFSKRRPGEGDIRLDVVDSHSMLGPLMTQTDTQDVGYFKTETRGPVHGKVPGINQPFLGDFDRKMMQAMSRPLNKDRTLTGNDGRFSKTIFMNEPRRNQALSATLAGELATEIDKATNGVYSKLTVLQAAQSGVTDYFCGGVDLEAVGFDIAIAQALRARGQKLLKEKKAAPSAEKEANVLFRDATRYQDRADDALRAHAALIWRTYTAARPLMTLVNGKARGTGAGLALAAKYCALQDSSELVVDGPQMGLTPFSGLTRLLARPETSLKFPGLAEFVMLTGTSLFAGDALRLGWTDLFTPLPDMGFHIKEWFDASEHMHNDAVAWQLGHLLDTCFRMKDAHTSSMERCAITPIRARWIEDAFADQPSVTSTLETLRQMEKVSLTDPHNTTDHIDTTPFTLSSVAEGIRQLESAQLRYTLAPWDVTPPEEEVAVRNAAEIFTSYVLERRGDVHIAIHPDREKTRRWREQREKEYRAHSELRAAPHPRHVYVRLEGCEDAMVELDFTFTTNPSDTSSCESLNALREKVLEALNMPKDRALQLGWYLPTLDTCPVHNDAEMMQALHVDPGLEDPSANLTHPPIYLVAKRNTLYMSEWAYAVRHQLLLQSPFALKATMALLKEVRGDGSAEAVPSLDAALSTEFKYAMRLALRPDFWAVGQHTEKSVDAWEAVKEDRERNIHKSYLPTRPLPDFEQVFERDATIDGHRFRLRPRWSPRTLEEVDDTAVDALKLPLSFEKEGLIALDVATHTTKLDRIEGMVDDIGGYEITPNLGESDKDGKPRVTPLASNAHVPTNVNFYEMARHPWEDTASSWRRDGFTEGSKAYFEEQYKNAEKSVYDEAGRGVYNYWPSKEAVEGFSTEADRQKLLDERLHGELQRAEQNVEQWARDLRNTAVAGKLKYKTEIATQDEKIYDDEYYRWFIKPGQNPNPSGLLIGHRQGSAHKSPEVQELESFLSSILSSNAGPSATAEGEDSSTVGVDVEETLAPDADDGNEGVHDDADKA